MPCIRGLHSRAGPQWRLMSVMKSSSPEREREEPRLLASDHQKWWQMRQIAEIVSLWWICRDERHLIALWSLSVPSDELSCGNFIWIMTITRNCWLIRSVSVSVVRLWRLAHIIHLLSFTLLTYSTRLVCPNDRADQFMEVFAWAL